MHAPSIRTRRIVSRSGGPVAVLLAGLLVWQGSNAAFTAETHNAGNNWETGSVLLTDDDNGAAMFAVANLTPGNTGQKCIEVTASSTVAGVVKTYVQSLTAGGLQNNIMITIERGAPGDFADCSTFAATATEARQTLAALYASHASFATGVLNWTKGTGVESASYRFSWEFDVTGLTEAQTNALQGTDVMANFEWELQNS
jgi:hypothetical protein